jgi:uncharacterized membrane protein HdeD (DUF308 family)
MTVNSVPTTATKVRANPWWLILLQGIFAILFGVLLITSPGATTYVLVQFLGFYWLIGGTFGLVSIFIDHTFWGWKLFTGILGILAGLAIIQSPLWATVLVPATLLIFLGIQGIVSGVVMLFQAFRGGGWGVGILGVLSILLGLVLVANPLFSAVTMAYILGFLGIIGGFTAIIVAFRSRK